MSGYAETAHAERVGGIDSGGRAVSPHVLDPTLKYSFARHVTAAGAPLWLCEGRAGSAADATGPGGAANPTALGSYPGYSFASASSQYMTIGGTNPLTGNATFTMWEWVNPTSIAAAISTGGIGTGLALQAAAFFVSLAGAGILSVEFGGGNGARAAAASVVAGSWQFFSYSKIAGAINTTSALYQNGSTLALGASSANTPNINAAAGNIGRFPGFANYWNGSIGVFGVCYGAMPASWHNAFYQATRPIFGV